MIRMPPRVREPIAELDRAGCVNRNFVHPEAVKPVTITGRPGDDARRYQIRAVRQAIEELQP